MENIDTSKPTGNVYKLVIDGTEQNILYGNPDDAMTDTFLIFPQADFSDWKSKAGLEYSWMDIMVGSEVVGQILEE